MINRYENMRCVIHYGDNLEKAMRKFQDKRVSWIINRLSAYSVEYLRKVRIKL